MRSYPRVALVFKTRLEENQRILNAISKYNRFHENWTAFVDDQAISQQDPAWLLENKWDGVIVGHTAPELLNRCQEEGIPIVDLSDNLQCHDHIPKIRPDNPAIGHKGGEYFAEKGFSNFAFCGFESEVWSNARESGFVESLKLMGHVCETFNTDYSKIVEPKWNTQEESRIRDWLKTIPKPVGLLCCNDLRALQVMNACRNLKLEVPEDVSILGINNEIVRCELSYPQLSSIPVNAEYYGYLAAKTITELINGKSPKNMEVLIEPLDVVTRRSSDFLSVEDKHVTAALQLIKSRACKGITVEEVVKQIHVSRSLLERRFRKYLGKSPQAEIRNVQIQKVKQLLVETDYTLAHIAELAGFEHPEYMSVVFKKMHQTTPNQFRQRIKVPT